jgi:hypothetical protein
MADQHSDLFWEVSVAVLGHGDVAAGTMMGLPELIDESRAFARSRP